MAQTIVTHRGVFKCTRLQFGVSVVPEIFQSLMERLLQGIPVVVPYFDDLLSKLRAILTRLHHAGLQLKREKCTIGVPQVEFLGFLIDAQGIHPTPSKIAAIKHTPTPSCKSELQAFLGLLNFYASLAEPLHRLLDSKTPWHWSRAAAASFQAVKNALTSRAVLSLPLTPLFLGYSTGCAGVDHMGQYCPSSYPTTTGSMGYLHRRAAFCGGIEW